jgi:hypothetical protein
MEPILDSNTAAALQAARRGLTSEATLFLGRQTHATTVAKRFAEDVAALVAFLKYEVERRRRGKVPAWSKERRERYELQLKRLNRILTDHLVQLADAVESELLTIEDISRFMKTGQLEEEEPTRQPAQRPPRKRPARRSTEVPTAA